MEGHLGPRWSPEEIAELITKREIGPLTGFRSRLGKPFAAVMHLTDELRVEFDFGQAAGEGEEAPDFSAQEPPRRLPQVRRGVFEHGMAYVCEKAVGPAQDLRFPLRQDHPAAADRARADAEAPRDGPHRSSHRFISKKGRPFKAFLVKTPDGKVGFEFAARGQAAAKEALQADAGKRASGGREAP